MIKGSFDHAVTLTFYSLHLQRMVPDDVFGDRVQAADPTQSQDQKMGAHQQEQNDAERTI